MSTATASVSCGGTIEVTTRGGEIGVITISSPARLNAFTSAMRRQLIEVLKDLDASPAARALIVTGAGDRAFSAGQDLTEARGFSGEDARCWVDEWAAVYRALLGLSTPLVAALNGYAVGAGFQVALMCDVRVAAATARVGMPEVDDAIPCITGSWSLTNLLGRAQIADLVLTGRLLAADDMVAWGIVSQVVPPEDLLTTVETLAATLAAKDPLAVKLDKEWLCRDLLARLPEAVEAAKSGHEAAFATGEPKRAMAEFLARTPSAPRG